MTITRHDHLQQVLGVGRTVTVRFQASSSRQADVSADVLEHDHDGGVYLGAGMQLLRMPYDLIVSVNGQPVDLTQEI